MEYEKPSTAPAVSRKHRNRSHSLSYSANVVYDSVFPSPATTKPPTMVDFGEIFGISGPSSSSSIPFLDVPELYEESVKVDVRSSKLDYLSVFRGFENSDFTIYPEELIVEFDSKAKWNHKKAGKISDVTQSSKVKNQISSPEVVSMKQSHGLYHQKAPHNDTRIKGTTQVTEIRAVSGYKELIGDTCLLPEIESGTHTSPVEEEDPCNESPKTVTNNNEVQVDVPSRHGSKKHSFESEADFEIVFGRNESNTKHPEGTPPSRRQRSMQDEKEELCNEIPIIVTDSNKVQVDVPYGYDSKKDSFESEAKFENVFDRNGSNTKHTTPPRRQHSMHNETESSEASMDSKSALYETGRSKNANSLCDALYLGEEADANSAAVASSTALKKAIEEAQLRINIAKQIRVTKNTGFSNRVKAKEKGTRKLEPQTGKCRDKGTESVGEVANSSKESSANEGEHFLTATVMSLNKSSLHVEEQNVSEISNSWEESFPRNGKQNDGKGLNSSQQLIPNEDEQIISELVDPCEKSFPNGGRKNEGDVANSLEHMCSLKEEGRAGEAVGISELSFLNEEEQIHGGIVNFSKQAFPNGCEVMNSFEGTFTNEEAPILGEHLFPEKNDEEDNSSEQSFLNKGEQILGEIVNSSEQSLPNISSEVSDLNEGKQILEEITKSSKQSSPMAGKINVGDVATSLEQSSPRKEEESVDEVVNSSEQSIPNEGEQCVGEVVNCSEKSSPRSKDRSIGEVVNSYAQLVVNEAEQVLGKMVSSSEQSFPNVGDQNVGGLAYSLQQSFSIKQECSVEEEDGERTIDEKLNSFKESFTSEGEQNLGRVVSSCKLLSFPNEEERITGEMVDFVEELFRNEEKRNTGEVMNSSKESSLNHEEQQVKRARRLWEAPGGLLKSTLCHMQEEESAKKARKHWERPSGVLKSTGNDGKDIHTVSDNSFYSLGHLGNKIKCVVEAFTGSKDFHENSYPTHEVLNHEGEEIVSDPQEMLFDATDMEVSQRASYIDENVGSMGSSLGKNDSISRNTPEGKEEHKAPRQRRVWKTSEDVYEMIKGLKGYSKTGLLLNDNEKETMKRCLGEKDEGVDDVIDGEETEDMTELQADFGLQENWNTVKQMFKQMFQTVDTNKEDEACCLMEYEQNHIDLSQIGEVMDKKRIEETSNIGVAGGGVLHDAYELDSLERVRKGREAYAHSNEDCVVEERKNSFSIYELIEEEMEAIEIADDHEVEAIPEVSEKDHLDQEALKLPEIKVHPNCYADILENDETDKFEKEIHEELAEETRSCGNIDDDEDGTKGLLFDLEEDSDIEEYDPYHEKSSSSRGMVDGVEEDVESDDNLESLVKESFPGYKLEAGGASQPPWKSEEVYETREKSELPSCLLKGDKKKKEHDDAEYLKEIEREKERKIVERAIREARERAFAEAKERAGRGAANIHGRISSTDDKLSSFEKASMEAKLREERAVVGRAVADARERALEKAKSQVGKSTEGFSFSSSILEKNTSSVPLSSSDHREQAQRYKARSERYKRTSDHRVARTLKEKKVPEDEQTEQNKMAEILDAEVQRWSNGKEGNLRALLSTLQYILGVESGWKAIHDKDLASSATVRKAYRKATLYVHPDKLQQRGATTQHRYICEKVFELVKEAWNKFSEEERQ